MQTRNGERIKETGAWKKREKEKKDSNGKRQITGCGKHSFYNCIVRTYFSRNEIQENEKQTVGTQRSTNSRMRSKDFNEEKPWNGCRKTADQRHQIDIKE